VQRQKKQRLIGLTGGVATGKSTVAGIFRGLGVRTIDTDKIAHKLLEKPIVKKIVVRLFGTSDRKKLARIVFNDPKKRRKLEKILHPLIFKGVKRVAKGVVIIEVPLLFEAGWDKYFDKTIVVSCSVAVQRKRCPKKFLNRIKTQMPLAKKKKRADFVINNSGSKIKTKRQVKRIFDEIIFETTTKSDN